MEKCYGKHGPIEICCEDQMCPCDAEMVATLKAEVETLREHKRLLFEENGRLLAEKEAGLWDANHPIRIDLEREREANAKLREALESIAANYTPDLTDIAYWISVGQHECAETLANDTQIARQALLAAKQDEGK